MQSPLRMRLIEVWLCSCVVRKSSARRQLRVGSIAGGFDAEDRIVETLRKSMDGQRWTAIVLRLPNMGSRVMQEVAHITLY